MKYEVDTVEEYIDALPDHRAEVIRRLRKLANTHLPAGFEEQLIYNMIGYVVPHSTYPAGYHVDPSLPLPFLNIASQKNHIAVYHSGIYCDHELMNWFVEEYNQLENMNKLDMGKSCIRFRNINKIPYELLGELFTKLTPTEWVELYEHAKKPS